MKQKGFTLLEMLVAIGVFAVIGLISSRILISSSSTAEIIVSRGEHMIELQRAMDIMRRDIEQLVRRKTRNEKGELVPFCVVGAEGLTITHSGWLNPLSLQRSELQRTTYTFEDGKLIRSHPFALDLTPDTPKNSAVILEGLSHFRVSVIDSTGAESTEWPNSSYELSESQPKIEAIRISMIIPPIGKLDRLWLVPQAVLEKTDDDSDS